jgi:hypothetical protein
MYVFVHICGLDGLLAGTAICSGASRRCRRAATGRLAGRKSQESDEA